MLAIAAILFLTILYFSELHFGIFNTLPSNIYLSYLNTKLTFNCNDCNHFIDKCFDTNGKVIYWVGGGALQQSGIDTYFYQNGTEICQANWSFSECKEGACADRYKDCPKTESCTTIMGSR
jgi:hypothetical protein